MQAQTVIIKPAANQDLDSLVQQTNWLDQVDRVTHWMEREDSVSDLWVGYGVCGVALLYLLCSIVRAIFS